MENDKNNSEPTPEHVKEAMKGYQPTDRDFQRTEEETDNISQSEIDAEKDKDNKRTEDANTKPDKNKIN